MPSFCILDNRVVRLRQAGRRDLGSADHRAEIAESGLAIIHSSPILLKSVTIARKLADELSISFGMTGVGSSPLSFRCSFWNSGSEPLALPSEWNHRQLRPSLDLDGAHDCQAPIKNLASLVGQRRCFDSRVDMQSISNHLFFSKSVRGHAATPENLIISHIF
jgi:hypothetical protein